uniref:Autophagy-related protein n=1 Tax=Psilocybe cubensis TaxID=181762 RepID=A0A8H8CM14_PSICU
MDRSSTKETALEEIEGVLSEPRTQEQYTGAIWTTKRPELWAYYLYYVGNNGLSGFNFGPSQFQNLLFLAGYDPVAGPGSACSVNGCVLPYLGEIRDINSIVLLTNGISFALQAFLLLLIGAWADYGTWRSVRLRKTISSLNGDTQAKHHHILHIDGGGCVICLAWG